MSPLEISILLHYFNTITDYLEGDFSEPAVRCAIDRFYKVDGLLKPTPEALRRTRGAYVITERGGAYVKALTTLPLPVQVWVMPAAAPIGKTQETP